MTSRKFYKTIYTLEVLSEEPLGGWMDLATIQYQIIEGECSGGFHKECQEELDGWQAAKALLAQGSDPEFFQLDENGNDVEE